MKKTYIFSSMVVFAGVMIFACSSKDDFVDSYENNSGNQRSIVSEYVSFDSEGSGSCVPPPGQPAGGASFQGGKEICITVGGKCYKCNPERGDDCLTGWLWDGKQVNSNWWFTEVSCGEISGGNSSSSTVIVPSSSSVGGVSGNCGTAVNYPALTSGSKGWVSRYWDGCKQSCSWGGKQQYSPLTSSDRCKACSSNGISEIAANDANKSSCDGGNSYTCFDFTPCKVNDNLAYAFAASPTDQCGKCFQIQFDGGFQHGSAHTTHAAIKGKTLIVMTSNMGGDVSHGQFDILIPGGGVGMFNAFSSQIGVPVSSLGEQYGGLLTACEKENNYNSSQYASCLTSKCNVFTNATLKAGCLFYVDWFKAANNPTMIYKEVACPQYLINKYKATLK